MPSTKDDYNEYLENQKVEYRYILRILKVLAENDEEIFSNIAQAVKDIEQQQQQQPLPF